MPYTKQEIFDLAAVGLLNQKDKSRDLDGQVCKFRGTFNKKCAVGFCNLPYLVGHNTILKKLQNIHDQHPIYSWKELLKQLAQDFQLSTAAIDNL